MSKIAYVHVDGPYSVEGRYGDEQPEWCVCKMTADDDAYEIEVFGSYDDAIDEGEYQAKTLNVEFVSDASPWS